MVSSQGRKSVDGHVQMMQSPPAAFNPLRVW
jgi:hypothetical protein